MTVSACERVSDPPSTTIDVAVAVATVWAPSIVGAGASVTLPLYRPADNVHCPHSAVTAGSRPPAVDATTA